MLKRVSIILQELRSHLPFTLIGVSFSLIVLAFVQFFLLNWIQSSKADFFESTFHLFHYSHIFLSAITTTALFYRHERDILKTILVGFFGTLIPCGLSDIIFPFLGGTLLQIPMKLHICLIEGPIPVLFANAIGILFGIISVMKFNKISYFSHSIHVFASSLASLFYLVTFGLDNWLHLFAGVFVVTTFAVVIPCCTSDIVIPLSFIGGTHGHEHEDEHTGHTHPH